MNSMYFSFVADYVPKGRDFPAEAGWTELTIKDSEGGSEVFKLSIEKAPLAKGELFSFRIKSGGIAKGKLPGWLFLTEEAIGQIQWGRVGENVAHAELKLPKEEELP